MKKIILFMIFITLINLVSAQSAMEYYLQGEDYLLTVTEEDNSKSIIAFQQAISMDSEFAHAYAGLSKAYAQKYQYFDKNEQWYNLAIQNAEKAQTVDPLTYDVSETHLALVRIYSVKGEDEKAKQEYEKMLNLYPDYKDLYSDLNEVLDEKKLISLEEENKSNIFWIILLIIIIIFIGYFIYKKSKSNELSQNNFNKVAE